MSENDSQNDYVESVRSRGFQEFIFQNSNATSLLAQINNTPGANRPQITPTEDLNNVTVNDGLYLEDQSDSVGTIIKREALKRTSQYSKLNASEMAMTDCGMNNILDLTKGTLTSQKQLFTASQWEKVKSFSPKSIIAQSDQTHFQQKIIRAIKSNDLESSYWNLKKYQRRASKPEVKNAYNLMGTLVDKLILHAPIFNLSIIPVPSEADIMIKIWSGLFEVLFFGSGLYLRWGEKVLLSNDDDEKSARFKLDMKIVMLIDRDEYPVSAIEFAPYAGPKKVLGDRSKLLVEGKLIYNSIVKLGAKKEDADGLKIVNMQIMGLEAEQLSIQTIAPSLYVANSVSSFTLPSLLKDIKQNPVQMLTYLFQYKAFTLDTAGIIKSKIIASKKTKKSMKRRLKEIEPEEESYLSNRITPTWRHNSRQRRYPLAFGFTSFLF